MNPPARPPAPGTRPEGISEEKAAARYVREMFSGIAGRYDLLNHLLSFQIDRYWRRAVARRFRRRLADPGARVLDLCCGTADLALALARGARAQIVCTDFSHAMLVRAGEKLRRRALLPLVVEADALQLPFPDHSYDLLVCSFGFRNLANYEAGLREILRVLRSGGEAGILEFSEPRGPLRPLYSFYFRRVLPRVGEWISGVKGSYSYLPSSVERFPEPDELVAWMRRAGFAAASARRMTGGIVTLYAGMKR